MNKLYRIRNTYVLKSKISSFFKTYKNLIFFLAFVLFVGIVTGILTASKYSGDLELKNLPDGNIVDFISGDKGSFGVFFAYFIEFLLVYLFLVFLNINGLFNILSFVIVGIFGYVAGFTVAGIITLYSFVGIINVVVLIIPFDLCILFLLILLTSISIRKYRICKRFGSNCASCLSYKKDSFVLFLILTLILFVKCMILPIMRITIIVN